MVPQGPETWPEARHYRYLASGDNYRRLMYEFRVSYNTINLLIPEVCQVIIDEYNDEVIACPTTQADSRNVA